MSRLVQKQCRRCHEVKSITEFCRQSASADGYQAYCKPCTNDKNKEWVSRHKELARERDTKYKATHRALYRDRAICRSRTSNALQRSRLTPQPCIACGTDKDINAHHPDYSDWTKITWLCGFHHRDYHAGRLKIDPPLTKTQTSQAAR